MNNFKSGADRMNKVLLCFFLTALCTLNYTKYVKAQIIGSGTGVTAQLPFYAYYGYSYSQQIYTAAELNGAGIFGPVNIQSIAFYCNTANVATTNFNLINVFMGNTNQSTFASTSGWIPLASLTSVGTWSLPATTSVGWMTFTFQIPFLWDGVSNIVIAMDENVPAYSSNFNWRSYTASAASGTEQRSLCYYSDTANPDPNAPPIANFSSSTIRSQLLLGVPCVNNSAVNVTNIVSLTGLCQSQTLSILPTTFNSYQWKKDNVNIPGASSSTYQIPPDPIPGLHTYVCEAFCEASGQTIVSTPIDVQIQNCYGDYSSPINYMLVQNVTTTGINTSNQTAQVQFDLNWGYAWKDSINWDAAWVFLKYKNAIGEWKPCKVKITGFDHGQGTPNNIQISADQMGAFVSLGQYGNAHMDISGMQLQWDYSAEGISNPGSVEVKVFAVEMVYMPQGDFNLFKSYYGTTITAPGSNFGVINNRLSPLLTYTGGTSRIKGDAGLDADADGNIDSPDYPTGFTPFYAFKYEMSEQQYADFLNCLNTSQQTSMGVAGSSITLNNGVYFASAPNRACNGFTNARALAYADWAGLRPMTILEYSKAALGPFQSSATTSPLSGNSLAGTPKDVGSGDSGSSARAASGSGYYGMKDMGGNVAESVVNLNSTSFSKFVHGNGMLDAMGNSDVTNWTGLGLIVCEPSGTTSNNLNAVSRGTGFRFARTAE